MLLSVNLVMLISGLQGALDSGPFRYLGKYGCWQRDCFYAFCIHRLVLWLFILNSKEDNEDK